MGANSSSSLPSSSLREAHDPVAKSMHWSGISPEWSSCGYRPATSPSPAILQQHVASWMDMSPPTRSSERPARTIGGGLTVCRTLDWHGCTGGIGTSDSISSKTAGTADEQGAKRRPPRAHGGSEREPNAHQWPGRPCGKPEQPRPLRQRRQPVEPRQTAEPKQPAQGTPRMREQTACPGGPLAPSRTAELEVFWVNK
jgi:hypothetical protein